MSLRILILLGSVIYISNMCCCGRDRDSDNYQQSPETTTVTSKRPPRHRMCACHKYRCSCCINFSFIHHWKALGCFNIQSLPGNLNIVLSFTFNNRHLAVFPIAGSRPMPFCKQLHSGSVAACLVIYNVHTNTPHDIMVCLYMELRVGVQSVATIHLDCIRKIRHTLTFIPIAYHHRKGTVLDVHVLPNDTALTILKQEFHWTREPDSETDALDSDDDESCGSEEEASELGKEELSEDKEEEGTEIKEEERYGPLHWLKRFIWWTYY